MCIKFRKLLKIESLFQQKSLPLAEIERPLGVFEFADWSFVRNEDLLVLVVSDQDKNNLEWSASCGHCPWTVLYICTINCAYLWLH